MIYDVYIYIYVDIWREVHITNTFRKKNDKTYGIYIIIYIDELPIYIYTRYIIYT